MLFEVFEAFAFGGFTSGGFNFGSYALKDVPLKDVLSLGFQWLCSAVLWVLVLLEAVPCYAL